ncbi:MAG: PepSY domain-containing protein [Hyphomicrobiaceae bacterium]
MRRLGLLVAMTMVVAALSTAKPLNASSESCFDDWSTAANIVKKHGLVPVDRLGALTRRKAGSRLIKTQLCKTKDGFYYNVVVRGPRGQLKRLKVNARQPFAHGAMVQ